MGGEIEVWPLKNRGASIVPNFCVLFRLTPTRPENCCIGYICNGMAPARRSLMIQMWA